MLDYTLGDWGILLLQIILIFVALLAVYRKYIISIFDPLFFFLVIQAFTIKMAFITIDNPSYLINFLLCIVCFTVGFILVNPKVKKIDDNYFVYSGNQLKFINYFNLFAFITIVLANVILISQKGLTILNDDPSLAKFSEFDEGGGLGAVRRINWGLGNLIIVSLLFTYFKTYKKRNLIMLFILFLFSLTSGSKGVVLNYICLIGLIGIFNRIELTKAFQNISKIKIPILIIGIMSALFILIKGGNDDSTIQDGLVKLGIRFLYFGDSIIYYYEPKTVAHFQLYNFVDFIDYQLNSILGFLRLVEYKKPLGNELLVYYTTSSNNSDLSIGPNTPFYISGHIFFGGFGALIYSGIIGSIVAYVRKKFFAMDKKKVSFIAVILLIFINTLITNFPQDTQLTISMLFDTAIFMVIPVFLSLILCYSPTIQSIE
jgi:oligosaccharide repeat unit polymerase